MTLKDTKAGDYIGLTASDENHYILKRNSKQNDRFGADYIRLDNRLSYSGSGMFEGKWEVKPLNQEEINWLEACIRAGKLVDKPKYDEPIYTLW